MKEESDATITLDREVFKQLKEYSDKMGSPITHSANVGLRYWLDKVAPEHLAKRGLVPLTPRFDSTVGYGR